MTLIRNKCTKVYLRGTKMLLKIGIVLCGASDDLHYLFCVWICLQGRTSGRQRDTISGRRTTAVAPKKNQQCHTFFLQYSTFASERPQVRTWGCRICFLPWEPSNLVTILYAWFLCICLKTASWLFWKKVWLFLGKTGWQPC